ncbi:MAG: SPFH domain-containing protein [Eggerthellaceae bacterium]|nr:SPFH domain-containing protein [Eggerthellaceae bacterium]
MGIFSNPNEVNYAGGRKHFTDVIKNTAPADVLFWQNGEEDFNTNSTLIVAESEEALFFKDGMIEQVFGGGRYQLSTENYPFISRLRNALSGGVSTFNCKVYFVRTADSQEILWGTQTPIQVRDPVWGMSTKVFARGAYKVRIADSKKFLIKMVGNNVPYLLVEEFSNYFQSQFSQNIKTLITQGIQSFGSEILGIMGRQEEFAQLITPRFQQILDDYGIQLVNFTIESLDIPDDDPLREKVDAALVERNTRHIEAITDADYMDVMGDRWARQQSAQILGDLANNPAGGGVAAAGAGFGMGVAAGGAFGNLAQEMFTPFSGGVTGGATPAAQSAPTGRSRFVQQGAGAGYAAQPAATGAAAQQAAPAQDGGAMSTSSVTADDAAARFAAIAQGSAAGAPAGGGQPAAGLATNVGPQDGAPSSAMTPPASSAGVACADCGHVAPAGSKFCPNCGAKLPQDRFCVNCGAKAAPADKFCAQCGTRLGE